MEKFWSRALFYKEWKTASWFAILLTGILIKTPVYDIMAYLNRMKNDVAEGFLVLDQVKGWLTWMLIQEVAWVPTGLIIAFALVVYLFGHNRQWNTGDLIASMPFSRQQIIATKWLTGALALAIPFITAFLLLSWFYLVNREWMNTSYMVIPQWALLAFFFVLTFYTFLFFVQTVMGHNVIAGVVGAICTMVPFFILESGTRLSREIFSLDYGNSFLTFMGNISRYTFWPMLIAGRVDYAGPNWEHHYYFYPHYGFRIGIMFLAIVALYFLAQLAYANNPLERNGHLLMFGFLEPVLIWGFALCLGLLGAEFFGLGNSVGPGLTVFILTLGFIIGFWSARKTVNHYER